MNTELQVFNFGEDEVRTVMLDGEPWFVGKDVVDVLGYSNSSKTINDHCKGVTKRYLPHPQSKDKTVEVSIIPERDVYRLIIRSKLPAAEKFEEWVFGEVLPSIRKHGMYATPQTVDDMIANPEAGIKMLEALREERNARKVVEDELDKWGNKIPHGQVSEITGNPRVVDVRGYKRSIPEQGEQSIVSKCGSLIQVTLFDLIKLADEVREDEQLKLINQQ